jgi:hypothetical protein
MLWQGVDGVNNPCPAGYRLPTDKELDVECESWRSNDADGAFASPLKLPMAGRRNNNDGSFLDVGSLGTYWSRTVSGSSSGGLFLSNVIALKFITDRPYGLSVRCLKD